MKNKKLLIIDDNPAILNSLKLLLKAEFDSKQLRRDPGV